MSCPFECEVLSLKDGELPRTRRIVVEAHLGRCEYCAATEEALELFEETLLKDPSAPLGAVDAALARLPARTRRVPGLVAAGLAAALLLLFFRPTPQPAPRPPFDPGPPAEPSASLPPPRPSTGPTLAVRVQALEPLSQDYRARLATLAGEIRRKGAAGSSRLAALLRSSDSELVERALAVAEASRFPSLAPEYGKLAQDPRFAPRAVRLLEKLATTRAVASLESALDGPAADQAVEALATIGGPAAGAALARHLEPATATLEQCDAILRADAAQGARFLLKTPSEPILRSLAARWAKTLTPVLKTLLRTRRGTNLGRAARLLGCTHDKSARKLLAELARRPGTGLDAVRALIDLDTPAAFDEAFAAVRRGVNPLCFDGATQAESHLLARLKTGTRAEQRLAIELLGRCGGPATVDALSELRLSGGLAPTATRTLAAIAEARDPKAVGTLLDLLDVSRASRPAARALASLPAGLVVPALLDRFESTPDVRRVLARIAGADLGKSKNHWKDWWDSRP